MSTERELFEAWAVTESFNIDRHYDDAGGEYHRVTTRWAWMAWQAARSADTSGARWLDIETVPKDGTRIMLAAAPDRVTLGQWMAPSEVPWLKYRDGYAPEEVWDEFDPGWYSEDGGFTDEHPPTHWAPLPEPPPAAPGGPAGARRPDDHERDDA